MSEIKDILKYYREDLKWNPPFTEVLSKYAPEGLEGYLLMRESVRNGQLPKKMTDLIFTILDTLDDEISGAKAHAVAAIDAGLTMEELVEAFMIVTIVKGINVLCKTGVEAIKAAEERLNQKQLQHMDSKEIKIVKIADSEQKSNIADPILRALPEWFGIEESIVEYVNGVKNSNFYVAYESDIPVGFISIKSNNIYTSEIYVTGIFEEMQNQGIGKKLLIAAEQELIEEKVKFLMVKTLGDSHPDKYYKNTREFYKKTGFYPIDELKELWGEENPCLILIKAL